MPFPTKLQLIKRKASQQFYVNFPSATAQMLDFQPGEQLEWILLDRSQLVLNRLQAPPVELKKNSSTSRRHLLPTPNSSPQASTPTPDKA